MTLFASELSIFLKTLRWLLVTSTNCVPPAAPWVSGGRNPSTSLAPLKFFETVVGGAAGTGAKGTGFAANAGLAATDLAAAYAWMLMVGRNGTAAGAGRWRT